MNDLRDHLAQMAGPPPAPTAETVEADLARGRRALRRRRAGQSVAAGAFAVAVAAAAVSFNGGGGAEGGGLTAPTGTKTDKSQSTTAKRLVAYTGAQPKGFTIDKVPDGWFIQNDDDYALTLAPKSVQNPGPNVDPSKDPVYDKSTFVGKIGIMLESKDQHGPSGRGTAVKVGDQQGTLVKSPVADDKGQPVQKDGDTGWTLWVEQPSGAYLIVQFWEGLGLSQDQMAELGAGVHVHKDAKQGVG